MKLFSLFVLITFALVSQRAQAATYFYIGGDAAQASSWNTALNGSGTAAVNADFSVAGNVFRVSSNRTANFLSYPAWALSAGNQLIVESGSTMAVNPTGVGSFTVAAGASIVIEAFATLQIFDNPTGLAWATGTISYSVNSTLEYRGTATRTLTILTGTEFPVSGTMPAAVVVDKPSSSVVINIPGPPTSIVFNSLVTVRNGAFQMTGSIPNLAFNGSPNAIRVETGGTLSTIMPVPGTVSVSGAVVSNGQLDLFGDTGGLVFAPAASLTVNGGLTTLGTGLLTVTIPSAITVTGGRLSLLSPAAFTLNGAVSVSGGTISFPSAPMNFINGALTFTGGVIDLATSGANLEINGATTVSGAASLTTSMMSVVRIAGSGTFTGALPLTNSTLGNLEILRSAATVRLGGTGILSIIGPPPGLSIAGGATLSTGARRITAVSGYEVNGVVRIDSLGGLANGSSPGGQINSGGAVDIRTGGELAIIGPSPAGLINNGTVLVNATPLPPGTTLTPTNTALVTLDNAPLLSGTGMFQYVNSSSGLRYINSSLTTSGEELPATMNGFVNFESNVDLSRTTVFNGTVNISNGVDLNPVNTNQQLVFNGSVSASTSSSSPSGLNSDLISGFQLVIGGTGSLSGLFKLYEASVLQMNRRGAVFRTTSLSPDLIVNTLLLNRGNIEIADASMGGKLTVGQPNSAGIILGGSDSSFVDGRLRLNYPLGFPNANQLLPVGDGTRYLPIRISQTFFTNMIAFLNQTYVEIEAFSSNSGGQPTMASFPALSTTEFWNIVFNGLSSSDPAPRIATTLPNVTPTTVWATSSAASGTYLRVLNDAVAGVPTTATITSGPLTSAATSPYYALGNLQRPPAILSFSPELLGDSTRVVIRGSDLNATTQVLFGGLPARSFQQLDSATVVAFAPANGTNGTISVFAGGGVAVSTQPYTYAPPPRNITFSPTAAGEGIAVIIRGNTFLGSTATVTFGGVPSASVVVNSESQITAIVPRGATSGTLAVQTVGGRTNAMQPFTMLPTPVIRSFSPSGGGRGTLVLIAGENFPTTGTVQILIGGVPAQPSGVTTATTAFAVVSTGATGRITMVSAAGIATSATVFTFTPPPIITSFTPDAGGRGSRITISGRNLLFANGVTIAGVPAQSFVATSDSTMTAVVNAQDISAPTTGVIRITNPAGSTTSTRTFTILPPPIITSFTPTQGTAGTVVLITGEQLSSVASVSIAGVRAQSFRILSPTRIEAVVGRITTSGTITITSPGGTTTSATIFRNVVFPPVISSISPLAGTSGTLITIRGENLGEVNRVSIGGVPITDVQIVSTSEITLLLPPEAQSGFIQVQSVGGSTTATQRFDYSPPPIIQAVVPPFASPGTPVSIVGLNLGSARSVLFGRVPAQQFTVLSTTQVVAIVGNGETGTVRVQTDVGQAESRTLVRVLPPGEIDSLALVDIYTSSNGSNWLRAANWLTNRPIAQWEGVRVENGRVVGLTLINNNLVGALPASVFALSRLQTLDLSNNTLSGVLPSVLSLVPELREIRLRNNTIAGVIPDSIVALRNLQVLDVSGNNLSGGLPATICLLPRLRVLDVSRNNLVGTIPACLSANTDLVRLNLSMNRFEGEIPPAIGNLPQLQELLLNNNQLSGIIPRTFNATLLATTLTSQKDGNAPAVAALPGLQRLNLSNNLLFDSIPSALTTLRTLTELSLANNRLVGTIPPALLANLTQLDSLDLSGNRLTGAIPATIGNQRRLKSLALSRNQLSGSVPAEFARLDSVVTITLDSNRLEGGLPAELQTLTRLRTLTVSNNLLTSLPRLERIRRLTTLNVAANRLTFRDLEPNLIIRETGQFLYSPQDSVDERRFTQGVLGLPFRLSVSVGGTLNRYQWFKLTATGDSAVSPVSPDSVLTIRSFAIADTGRYFCRVTNTQVTGLTLVSRLVTVGSILPPAPTAAPELIFPSDAARDVTTNPLFQWTEVPNGGTYIIEVSTSPQFPRASTDSASVAGTQTRIRLAMRDTEYFWRVRAVNAGGAGPFSRVSSFRTVRVGEEVAFSSLNFGRVSVGDRKTVRGALANVSSQSIILRDIVIIEGNADNVFTRRLDLPQNGLTLTSGQDFNIDFDFEPKLTGTTRGTIEVRYTSPSAVGTQVRRFDQSLVGRGAPIKIVEATFGTIRVGRGALTTALLINNDNSPTSGRRSARIETLRLTDDAGRTFSLENTQTPLFIAPGDTASVVLRAEPMSAGFLRGQMRMVARMSASETDSTDDGRVTALARMPLPTDITLAMGVRTVPTIALPGDTVQVQVYLSVTDRPALFSSGIPTNYRAWLQFNRNALSLDANRIQRGIALRNTEPRNHVQRVFLPPDWWTNPTDSILARVQCRAVLGEVDTTSIFLERVDWGGEAAYNPTTADKRVFVEVPLRAQPNPLITRFRVDVCVIDGTQRMLRQGQGTLLSQARPNPTTDEVTVSYTLREAGEITLALFNSQGVLVKTLAVGVHRAGEHIVSSSLRDLPSGSYLMVLTTPTQMLHERVDVVK
jgi:Leucine-rich repeat (LRR) protein